jgi:hypothetical protein
MNMTICSIRLRSMEREAVVPKNPVTCFTSKILLQQYHALMLKDFSCHMG